METDTSTKYDVYTGPWINWSTGQMMGSTLTLTRADANFLIAFVAFFVAVVGSRLWRIICFVLHWTYSSQDARDGLHHQRQAFFRNSANPEAGLVSLLDLAWGWRRNARRSLVRLLFPLALAIIWAAGFAIASGFSSKIAIGTMSEVLLSGKSCAIITQAALGQGNPLKVMTQYQPYISRYIASTSNYAEQCYGSGNTANLLECVTFQKKQLPATIITKADCPFNETICQRKSDNIILDTGYLDLHEHFGVNLPPQDRLQYRRVVQCAPLVTQGYTSMVNITAGGLYKGYHYGGGDATDNLTYSYAMRLPEKSHVTTQTPDYSLRPFSAYFKGGEFATGTFEPISELRVTDADISLVFLSATDVWFMGNVTDPWYSASTSGSTLYLSVDDDPEPVKIPVFTKDEEASPLACTTREQFCSPGLPFGNCTALSSSNDAKSSILEGLAANSAQRARAKWAISIMRLGSPSMTSFVQIQGSKALSSRPGLNSGMQGPLPDNQWQLDAQFWFNSGTASLQTAFVTAAMGPGDPDVLQFAVAPNGTVEESFCQSQKILSTAYVSFSIFGIAFIFVVGGLSIIASITLDPIMAALQKKYNIKRYQQLEWCTNETLQLQRLAHEGLGVGTWTNTTNTVPVTQYGEMLAKLDLADPSHPRLECPVEVDEEARQTGKPALTATVTEISDLGTTEMSELGVRTSLGTPTELSSTEAPVEHRHSTHTSGSGENSHSPTATVGVSESTGTLEITESIRAGTW